MVAATLTARALPFVMLLALSSIFCVTLYNRLAVTVTDPQRAAVFVAKDSKHYLEMAEAFEDGRLGRLRPHRQPLYPALLAAGKALGGDTPMAIGSVNLGIGLFTLFLLFGVGRWLFGSWWTGIAGGVVYASNEFVRVYIADRVMTEPTFVLAAIGAVAAAFKYLEDPRTRYLALASGAAGLAYLARPNGLFLFGAMCVALMTRDLLRGGDTGRRQALAKRYAIAGCIFVVVAAPSWIPRTVVYGNPVYHGSLSNYLWVDTYEEGRISDPIYGPRDYLGSHDLGDVLHRVAWGVEYVFAVAPRGFGRSGLICYVVAMVGLLLAIGTRMPSRVFLTVFMLLQASPLIWTAMSNPNNRVVYGGLLPFLLVYVMILVDMARHYLETRPVFSSAAGRPA